MHRRHVHFCMAFAPHLPGLVQHPLAAKMGDSPADVIAAAQQITPQLSTLFAHPLLQEGIRSLR